MTNDSGKNELIKDKIRKFFEASPDFQWQEGMSDGQSLIEAGVLDSLSVVRLAGFLEETFGVQMEAGDLIEENFGSLDSMEKMIKRKKGEPL